MQHYTAQQRLHYIGGPQVLQGMWPSSAADWWDIAGETCVAAYAPKGAASLAASYTNLANPGTYDAAPGVAPTFDAATGWTFNGTTQYLTTGVVPSTNQQWSVFVQFSNGGGGSIQTLIGSIRTEGAFFLRRDVFNNLMVPMYTSSLVITANSPVMSSGNFGFAGLVAYRNGAFDTNMTAIAPTIIDPVTIGKRNNPTGGFSSHFYTGDIQAIAIYSTTLDATQVATLSAAMAAL